MQLLDKLHGNKGNELLFFFCICEFLSGNKVISENRQYKKFKRQRNSDKDRENSFKNLNASGEILI